MTTNSALNGTALTLNRDDDDDATGTYDVQVLDSDPRGESIVMEVCKTSTPGSNPGGASKFISKSQQFLLR